MFEDMLTFFVYPLSRYLVLTKRRRGVWISLFLEKQKPGPFDMILTLKILQ